MSPRSGRTSGWRWFYNLVAVPLAGAGILEPLHAAIAMSASSVARHQADDDCTPVLERSRD